MKTLKESRSEFLKYLDEAYHPNFVYYPACGADKTPKQIFGENKVIHLSLPENEAGVEYLERLGRGIKLLGDMAHSPIADRSVDLIYLNLQGIQLSEEMVGDFFRVLKNDGVIAIEDRHLYDDSRWNKTIESLKQRFKEVEITPEFSGKAVEFGVRPKKDYGKQQELCEEESSIVDSEEEMVKLVSSNKDNEGFVDEIRYSVMKKIRSITS